MSKERDLGPQARTRSPSADSTPETARGELTADQRVHGHPPVVRRRLVRVRVEAIGGRVCRAARRSWNSCAWRGWSCQEGACAGGDDANGAGRKAGGWPRRDTRRAVCAGHGGARAPSTFYRKTRGGRAWDGERGSTVLAGTPTRHVSSPETASAHQPNSSTSPAQGPRPARPSRSCPFRLRTQCISSDQSRSNSRSASAPGGPRDSVDLERVNCRFGNTVNH